MQLLDGVTAAVFAVMVPLVVADLTRGTGHFNLGQGILGTATGIGASLSATLAGYVSDRFGSPSAFAALAAIAFVGLTVLWFLMPETRPEQEATARSAAAMRACYKRRRVVGDQPQVRRDGVRQAAIDGKIILRHAARGEALLETAADFFARQMAEPVDGADGAVDVLDDEAGEAVVDDFRHRAAIERDDRRAAGHGLDHDQAERLRPVDRHQQRDRAAQEFRLLLVGDLADEFDIAPTSIIGSICSSK